MLARYTYLNNRLFVARAVLVITYCVGLAGISIPQTRPLTLSLTPIHLLLTAALLLAFSNPAPKAIWLTGTGIVVAGFLVELMGVRTGLPFGNYEYMNNLGPKLLAVPPIIGINWLILVLITREQVERWRLGKWLLPVVAALLMVAMDRLIEPVAPKMGLWYFWGGTAPVQNYIGWLFISLLMQVFFIRRVPVYTNPLGGWVLGLQVIFFAVLNIVLG